MNLNLEKKLWQKGYKYILGLDEAGRGALAGPIVAGGVIFSKKILKKKIKGINDSKLLSPKKREELFEIIIKNSVCFGMAKVSEKTIDKLGINKANELVFKRLIKKLNKKPDFILIDGKINLKNLKIPYLSIVDADAKVFSCAAASILAKVFRDRLMVNLSKKFPNYNFEKNKGYPTKKHYLLLKKYGISPCHRKSFRLK
jgi:ribonuclease HII